MLFAISLLSLIGCSKNHIPPQELRSRVVEENLIYAFEDYSLPVKAAKAKAQNLQPKTKSGESTRIKNIGYLTSANPFNFKYKSKIVF